MLKCINVLCPSAPLSFEMDPCVSQIPPGLLERPTFLQRFLTWILVNTLPFILLIPTPSLPNLI